MNALVEHHKDSIQFGYRCFDRLLMNGLIQPFDIPPGYGSRGSQESEVRIAAYAPRSRLTHGGQDRLIRRNGNKILVGAHITGTIRETDHRSAGAAAAPAVFAPAKLVPSEPSKASLTS